MGYGVLARTTHILSIYSGVSSDAEHPYSGSVSPVIPYLMFTCERDAVSSDKRTEEIREDEQRLWRMGRRIGQRRRQKGASSS